MNKVTGFAIFAIGAAIGSLVTWKLVKTKYERIAQEEINSVKETFAKRKPVAETPKQTDTAVKTDDSRTDFEEYKKYRNLATVYNKSDEENEEEGEPDMSDGPQVISPDDFGQIDYYDIVSLNYYADGVLTDDWDNVIEDPDETVGPDIESHFGEYEEDTVYVQNDEHGAYYEICRDLRNYSDVVGPAKDLDNE